MVKVPPCSQYEPPKHSLMTSKLGTQFCRVARQAGPKRNKPKAAPKPKRNKPKAAPKPKRKATPSPNINQPEINFLRRLLANIRRNQLNRKGQIIYNKAAHPGAYLKKNDPVFRAANGYNPKQTINQARATRAEAIRAAEIIRRRMGLPVLVR